MDYKFQRKALCFLLLISTIAIVVNGPEKPLRIELVQSVLRGITTALCLIYLVEEKPKHFQLVCLLALVSSAISALSL